jgi:hypothetical protein
LRAERKSERWHDPASTRLKIPVFVSCPTTLAPVQEASRQAIFEQLELLQLEPRAIGRSDYPNNDPLREVLVLARRCAGGLVLGFSQFTVAQGVSRAGTSREQPIADMKLPTPWNHIEGSIIYSLGLPIMILSEPGISDGIFDRYVAELFIHNIPSPEEASSENFRSLLLRWSSAVRRAYYNEADK